MSENKEVEAVEKYYALMMELKISITELAGKIDNLTDMKETLVETKKVADSANNRSTENEKDINDLQTKVSTKANKEDVERIVKEKDNWKRNLPAWVAAIIAIVALLLPYVN
ncbi:hypothetical protein [Virgibacillus litoralis]|uniref:Nucleic acid-binding Zn-ribbon protein n=1 Tax=Virgibacillus litoralis TaxID=578221 RepID=A0ABS4HHA2_9BACI|nr:hypothetical protein [Virgibacillus litoralis]MBP1950307.1 putative nucleic acid-binding Zn-ribbon protein [Virgibacillus litoralis]